MNKRLWLLLLVVLIGLSPLKAFSEEALCAVVKIEISQELSLERQAFEANMSINNTLDSFSLDDINIEILFSDKDNIPVLASSNPNSQDAKFFIDLGQSDSITGLSEGADGQINGGSIVAGGTGKLQWLIIPAAGTGGELSSGELYFVGATLSVTYGGTNEVIEVAPDSIVVSPQPALVVDYFLPDEVNGDNPFTPEIEAVEPYTLGVRLSNTGGGAARNVKLQSAQPKIVENKQGLAVDFRITGSYIDDQAANNTLLLDFGDIPANTNRVGRWIMETSLTGRFTEFTATYSHTDEYGGKLTSLIDSVNTHTLLHDVILDTSGRDNIRDYLIQNADQVILYESEPNASSQANCIDCLFVASVSATIGAAQAVGETNRHSLNLGSTDNSLVYIKIADPYSGQSALSKVTRNDGKVLRPENYWLSKTIQQDKINYDYFLNVFDANPVQVYQLEFGGVPQQNLPPEIQSVSNQTTYETGLVQFLVVATDANNTIPTVTIRNKPAGANFQQDAPGQAVFQWQPQLGQAGIYRVTFEASDGVNKAVRDVSIQVNSNSDRDGDGMDDQWELDHFGTLDRDGTGDFDGDGFSDLVEFNNQTDPTVQAVAPGAPVLSAPIYGGEVTSLTPILQVTNSAHDNQFAVTYEFEVYADEAMSELVAQKTGVAEGETQTATVIDNTMLVSGMVIEDNHSYYWRARAQSVNGISEWENGLFFVNTENDAPSIPVLSQPVLGGQVDSYQPALIINNSNDIDKDTITYDFKVYAIDDTQLTTPLAQVMNLAAGANGSTQWQVATPLSENTSYQWQVVATDEHGLATLSSVGYFFVSTMNDAPLPPAIASPQTESELIATSTVLEVFNGSDPESSPLQYYFELDQSNSFDSPSLIQSGPIASGATNTQWDTGVLEDNTQYFWRAKTFDGELESPWVQANFFVNTANDAPSKPTVSNPGQGATVLALTPTLQLNPSADVDGDMISYVFELYADSVLVELVASIQVSVTQWLLPTNLNDNTTYYWRARAIDEHGALSDWTLVHSFFVDEGGIDDLPTFSFVKPDTNLSLISGLVEIQWIDQDPDSNALIEFRAVDGQSNETTIVSGLLENDDGVGDQYQWNVNGLVPGQYTLKAIISDDENTIEVVACCTITIVPAQGGVTVVPTTSLVTEETGTDVVSLDVTLDRVLYAGKQVTINLSIDDASEGQLISSNSLYFDDQNWNVPQIIQIKGVNDCLGDGDQSYLLVIDAVQSNDSGYQGIDPQDITITNSDNEFAGQTLFICNYQLQSQQTVSGSNLVDFVYKAVLVNQGEMRLAPSADLQLFGSSMSLVGDGHLEFPNINAGGSVVSNDTFTLRYLPNDGLDAAKLQWDINPGQVAMTDLAVDMFEWKSPITMILGFITGYRAEYKVKVENLGPLDASDIDITATYPNDITILNYTISNGSCPTPLTHCVIDSLPAGSKSEIWISVWVPNASDRLINLQVSGQPADSNPQNNSLEEEFGGSLSHFFLLVISAFAVLRKKRLLKTGLTLSLIWSGHLVAAEKSQYECEAPVQYLLKVLNLREVLPDVEHDSSCFYEKDLSAELIKNYLLVDIRSPQDFDKAHIKGAINSDAGSVHRSTLFRAKPTLLVGYTEDRSSHTALCAKLRASGNTTTQIIPGGVRALALSGLPIAADPKQASSIYALDDARVAAALIAGDGHLLVTSSESNEVKTLQSLDATPNISVVSEALLKEKVLSLINQKSSADVKPVFIYSAIQNRALDNLRYVHRISNIESLTMAIYQQMLSQEKYASIPERHKCKG